MEVFTEFLVVVALTLCALKIISYVTRWRGAEYIEICSQTLGCAVFYTVIIGGSLKDLFQLNSEYTWLVFFLFFAVISFLGLSFDVPRIRNAWLGGMIEEKFSSLIASWISMTIAAAAGTIIFMHQAGEVELLSWAPSWLVAVGAFVIFMLIMVYISFYSGGARRGR